MSKIDDAAYAAFQKMTELKSQKEKEDFILNQLAKLSQEGYNGKDQTKE